MKKLHRNGIIAVLLTLSATSYYFFTKKSPATTEFVIETAKVETGDVARIVAASGAVRADTTVEIGSQVSGQITELFVDYNSIVTENQIIAQIDPQTFQSRVNSATADVASAKANLEVQIAMIERATANVEKYEKEFARQAGLFKEDAIALTRLEDAERELKVGKADVEVSRAQMRSAQATLAQRLASLESAELDLERSIIRSPIDGVVIERSVDVGQTVAASFSSPVLFKIANDLGNIRIDAAVVESDIGGIDTGDLATFRVDAYPDRSFNGVVEQVRLSSQTLQNVVTYTVVIAAQNPNGILLPGMTANVEITAEKRQNVLRIAEAATRFRPPTNGPTVNSQQNNGPTNPSGVGPPNGQRGNPMSRILEELQIESDLKKRIEDKISEDIGDLRKAMSGGGPGVDRDAIRQQMQSRIDKVLRENLSEQDFKKAKAIQSKALTQRRVELYQTADNNQLNLKSLQVGISDGKYIEIIRGAELGDSFVTRLTMPAVE